MLYYKTHRVTILDKVYNEQGKYIGIALVKVEDKPDILALALKDTFIEPLTESQFKNIKELKVIVAKYEDEYVELNNKYSKLVIVRLYRVLSTIKNRCYTETNKSYKYYGAKGVSVYEGWHDSLLSFIDYLYSIGYNNAKYGIGKNKVSIDRIDPYGNYEPGNLRLASPKVQANNQRKDVLPPEER